MCLRARLGARERAGVGGPLTLTGHRPPCACRRVGEIVAKRTVVDTVVMLGARFSLAAEPYDAPAVQVKPGRLGAHTIANQLGSRASFQSSPDSSASLTGSPSSPGLNSLMGRAGTPPTTV